MDFKRHGYIYAFHFSLALYAGPLLLFAAEQRVWNMQCISQCCVLLFFLHIYAECARFCIEPNSVAIKKRVSLRKKWEGALRMELFRFIFVRAKSKVRRIDSLQKGIKRTQQQEQNKKGNPNKKQTRKSNKQATENKEHYNGIIQSMQVRMITSHNTQSECGRTGNLCIASYKQPNKQTQQQQKTRNHTKCPCQQRDDR